MLRIQNIEKLEGAKLDKWNIVVNSIKAISVVDGPDYGEYYEFRLGQNQLDTHIVRLDRDYSKWNDGNPLYRLFNLKSPKKEIKVSIASIKNKDILMTREHLLNTVWEDSFDKKEKTVNVAIKRLKAKIDPDGKKDYIRSIRGEGYIFC